MLADLVEMSSKIFKSHNMATKTHCALNSFYYLPILYSEHMQLLVGSSSNCIRVGNTLKSAIC